MYVVITFFWGKIRLGHWNADQVWRRCRCFSLCRNYAGIAAYDELQAHTWRFVAELLIHTYIHTYIHIVYTHIDIYEWNNKQALPGSKDRSACVIVCILEWLRSHVCIYVCFHFYWCVWICIVCMHVCMYVFYFHVTLTLTLTMKSIFRGV